MKEKAKNGLEGVDHRRENLDRLFEGSTTVVGEE